MLKTERLVLRRWEDGFFGAYYGPKESKYPGKGMVVCSGTDGSYLFTQLGAEMFYEAGMWKEWKQA